MLHPFRFPVPAGTAGVPAATQSLEGVFLRLCIATNPDPEAYEIDLQVGKFHQFSDFIHNLLLGLVVIGVFMAIKLFAVFFFQPCVILAVNFFHCLKAAAKIRVKLASKLAIAGLDLSNGL